MTPISKKKKRSRLALKSTSEEVTPDEKALKKKGKTGNTSESTSKPVDYDELLSENGNEDRNAKESSSAPVARKPCTWLKLGRLNPQIETNASAQNSDNCKVDKSNPQVESSKDQKRERTKEEGKSISQVKANKNWKSGRTKEGKKNSFEPNGGRKNIRQHLEQKGKGLVNEMHEAMEEMNEKQEKNLGGLIFMCNAKTKPDCFHYQVMGMPANKKEVVLDIKLGLKIFLYDYDLKLLYGIFEASSAGGMKLEPAAFGGGFPAQVRFTVLKNCIPLPESVFRKAIEDSYDEKTLKFDARLTVKQVKHLTKLFQPTPWLKSAPVDHEKQFSQYHVSSTSSHSQDPLFLTEQEYRSNGLQQGRHLLPTTAGGDSIRYGQAQGHRLRNPSFMSDDSTIQHREVNQQPDPLFLGEREYHFYGLKGPQRIPDTSLPMDASNQISRDYGKEAFNPYGESTTSLVNRYLLLPRTAATAPESYPLSGSEIFADDHITGELRAQLRVPLADGERRSAPYTLRDQSNFSQIPLSVRHPPREQSEFRLDLHRESDLTAAPISRRYSFGGPSLSRH